MSGVRANEFISDIQNALKRVESAFDNFFSRVREGQTPGYPRFRSSSRYDSFTYPQSGFSLKGKKLQLSKIGKVTVHLSRAIEGEIKTCTIKREADGWYVIFAVEEPKKKAEPAPKESVGIDVGIESFATLSDDEAAPIENPQYFRGAEKDLKKAQRRVSRRVKGSKGRKKAVRWLGKKHLKVKRQRRDFHPKSVCRFAVRAKRPPQHGIKSRGPAGDAIRTRGTQGSFFATKKLDGMKKKRPAAINNAPRSFNNGSLLPLFLLSENKIESE